MSKVLVIGCGGVASVAISKCCQVSDVFTELCIASRTKSKCDALAAKLAPTTRTKITTAQVDGRSAPGGGGQPHQTRRSHPAGQQNPAPPGTPPLRRVCFLLRL